MDVHFPMLVYKKLMNCTLSIDDLIEFDPSTGNGLKAILESTSPTLKDDLCLKFVYEYESCWGE